MSTPVLLRAFVNERMKAAVEEIVQVFEQTIAKYEEEASSSHQEIDRLRGLLLLETTKTDSSQSSICKEETLPEEHNCEQELSVYQRDPEPRVIKVEHHELWANQQQEEEQQQQQQFKDADVSYLPHSSVWEKNKLGDTRPTLQPQTQNSESEEHCQDETQAVQFMLPLAQTSSSQTERKNESVQDARVNERCAASLSSNQTQTEQSQLSFITCIESTELPHLNSVAPDYCCYLCNKSFASNHHLKNHAFRIHSIGADVHRKSTESLNVHLNTHKGSKCCGVCGKQCTSTTALTEHMASHAGVKLHRCHVCGKECSRKGDLKIHMRIHTGEKPFCCTHCDKGFTHSGHLKKHMRSHTGERPHRCDICGKGFLQKAHLKYHLGTHAQKY
ncbi:zinc finger protein 484-like [Etheostoma cragini]|uniref:zinc finger protein 484-like n=1 Tax=Etheostoma cragini TaxID=417921 RepID=UPI00155EBD94|nr:zinc finger protein 484-like [Etheostoma cragini]